MDGCQGLGGRGLVFNGNRISVLQDEVLEICYTTMWIYLTLLNCILKNGYNGNLMLHAFFFTIKNKTKLFKALQLVRWRNSDPRRWNDSAWGEASNSPGCQLSHCAPPAAVKALTCGVSGYVQETGITSFSLTVFLCAKCYCFCCSVDEEFGKFWEMKLSKCLK